MNKIYNLERPQKMVLSTSKYFHHNIPPRHFFKIFFGFWGRESCSFYPILTPKPLVTAYLEFKQTNIKIFCLWTSNQIDTRVTWTVWIRIDTAFSSCWIDRYHCNHISWLILKVIFKDNIRWKNVPYKNGTICYRFNFIIVGIEIFDGLKL